MKAVGFMAKCGWGKKLELGRGEEVGMGLEVEDGGENVEYKGSQGIARKRALAGGESCSACWLEVLLALKSRARLSSLPRDMGFDGRSRYVDHFLAGEERNEEEHSARACVVPCSVPLYQSSVRHGRAVATTRRVTTYRKVLTNCFTWKLDTPLYYI